MLVVQDKETYSLTARRYTEEGYLEVPARVARTGIQQYRAGEIAPEEGENDPGNLRGRDPLEVVNVYRPPEEVFARESLTSYRNADVTNDHPPLLVDAATYKKYAVGNVMTEGYADGEYVRVDLCIKDGASIADVESGKKELSAGYKSIYEYAPGALADGTPYEFIQRRIRINHVALVDTGRAGPGATIFDHNHLGGKTMPTVTIDGKSVGMPDESTAHLIQKTLDESASKQEKLEDELKNLKDSAAEKQKQLEAMKAEKDAALEERDEAQKASSDEAMQTRLTEIATVKDAATKVAGEGFTCDSLNSLEIKREALAKARPSMDWAKQTEAYINAAFDFAKEQSSQDHAATTHNQFARDMATSDAQGRGDEKVVQDARNEYNSFLHPSKAGGK